MSATTKIEWCDATWNPITGCTPCSPGCDHCYAANMVRRFPALHGYKPCDIIGMHSDQREHFCTPMFHPGRLDIPLHWRRPRRIFVCSMGDLFHENVPENWRYEVFFRMAQCRHHTFLCLTKRPQAMLDYCSRFWPSLNDMWDGQAQYLPNVWLGVTVCNQAEADAKVPVLLQTPAALRFVSVEPMLGPVDLRLHDYAQSVTAHSVRRTFLSWVICGGETGPGARPMHPNWVRNLRDQCESAGVPFFFKGWGDWAPNCLCQTARPHRQTPRPEPGPKGCMFHCGKGRAGSQIDGRWIRQFPEVHL